MPVRVSLGVEGEERSRRGRSQYPAAAPLARQLSQDHRERGFGAVRYPRLEAFGAVRPGLDRTAVAGLIWLMTDAESFEKLTRDIGWTDDQAERRVVEALKRAVLR